MLMLVNRETGKGLRLTLFESEGAMRRGDEALAAFAGSQSARRPQRCAGPRPVAVPSRTVRHKERRRRHHR
jgi:hypothetical protein